MVVSATQFNGTAMRTAFTFFFLFNGFLFGKINGKIPKIAIIGGGIGGTSAAYFLNELFNHQMQIELYEEKEIGGRLATVNIDDEDYEIGGSIIHNRNKYMVEFSKLFNLRRRNHGEPQKLGIYTGEFVFVGSSINLITLTKLFWQYGIGLFYLNRTINKLLLDFERIYKLQEDGETYVSVKDLLHAMNEDFVKYLNISTYAGFRNEGLSEAIVDQLISSTIRCNYGQSTSVHKLLGSVSVAGANSELWSVEGGNKKVAEHLMKASQAILYQEKVTQITLTKSQKYIVSSSLANRTYDVVIIARPLTEDHEKIHFEGFDVEIAVPGRYHHTFCTLVSGLLNHTYFGFEKADDVPNVILTANDLFFNSISQIFPVSNNISNPSKKKIWKIFSKNSLSKSDFNNLFLDYTVLHVIDWLAYPHYNTENRSDNFVLNKNLFYNNAIEWAASAMEMSVISSKNVALLIHKNWRNKQYISKKQEVHEDL